ncbi:DegT/DnrJ/EryC1/StrS family aminotransferase [candidate division KSB1 bacterium]|nr:DegT/DnrJ/EryC1/StrS family aminotransferase [candidate division KSB1 bacterium]NIR72666.1 DegT/DnrJ/EryC1/StrS family aminotransferase [candidate division KSB1 bacterium]NIS25133.1 DegT/DnrJ/EryC1/StrS family aminotransferase [candidate division KSB1 bacterium]NIT72040.1 DegT/DnrJ/EryC1/StrS family aminotransferase [candidate division KSB1 bacterium]NIU25832.1 DegT/DnrJ/EryC1/StrS family aminotransferase [candidate division KSB1 bacterium]
MDRADLPNSLGQNGKIRLCYPITPSDVTHLKEQLNQVFESGFLSNFGQFNDHLEKRIRELLQVGFAFTVPNATTGLQIVLSTLPKGYEVVVPSFAFPSTVHAIIHAGLKPVFVDIDPSTYNISIKDTIKKITNKTSAILAANNFGTPCPMTELENIARNRDLTLFFDSATALGSKYRGVFLGAFGDAEIFSFSGTKIVSAGEGGIITTNNRELAEKIKCYRNYGYSSDKTDCLYTGFNGKLDELSAVFALWSLRHMESQIAYRKKLAEVYRLELATIEGLKFQNIDQERKSNYCLFPIEIDSKEFGVDASTLIDGLKANGIEAVRNFFPPVHKTTAYKEHNQLKLDKTEALSQRIVCLPLHSKLSIEDVYRVCRIIKKLRRLTFRINQQFSTGRKETADNNGETLRKLSAELAQTDLK